MRQARILVNNIEAGIFEKSESEQYRFTYHPEYRGAPVSKTRCERLDFF